MTLTSTPLTVDDLATRALEAPSANDDLSLLRPLSAAADRRLDEAVRAVAAAIADQKRAPGQAAFMGDPSLLEAARVRLAEARAAEHEARREWNRFVGLRGEINRRDMEFAMVVRPILERLRLPVSEVELRDRYLSNPLPTRWQLNGVLAAEGDD